MNRMRPPYRLSVGQLLHAAEIRGRQLRACAAWLDGQAETLGALRGRIGRQVQAGLERGYLEEERNLAALERCLEPLFWLRHRETEAAALLKWSPCSGCARLLSPEEARAAEEGAGCAACAVEADGVLDLRGVLV